MIYVASSWRNPAQPGVVATLRRHSYPVYDFRNPAPGNTGFAWAQIDPHWEKWTTYEFVGALKHPIAAAGFKLDMDALKSATAVVLVLPCGRSAHLEAGWIVGAGRPLFILAPDAEEPELMYAMATAVVASMDMLLAAMKVAEVPRG